MTSHAITEIKNAFFLMLFTNFTIFMTGCASIGRGVVIDMACGTLPIGSPVVQGEAMIKGSITEIIRILMTTTAGTRKMVGRWLMAGHTIPIPNQAVIKLGVLKVSGIEVTSGAGCREMIGGRLMTS